MSGLSVQSAVPQSCCGRLRILAFAGVLAALSSAAAPAQDADVVWRNGKIVTVDSHFSIAEAMAVRNGRFLAVGSNSEIRKYTGNLTRVVDLHVKTVIPGFEDSHLHGAGGGPGVDLSSARSLADLYAAIRRRVERSQAGELIVSNSDWHEAQLKEQRLPLRRDLDTAAPANPVVLVRGGHEYILNSASLAKWHIDKSTVAPEGGQISRYPDGEPN